MFLLWLRQLMSCSGAVVMALLCWRGVAPSGFRPTLRVTGNLNSNEEKAARVTRSFLWNGRLPPRRKRKPRAEEHFRQVGRTPTKCDSQKFPTDELKTTNGPPKPKTFLGSHFCVQLTCRKFPLIRVSSGGGCIARKGPHPGALRSEERKHSGNGTF